MTAAHQYRSPTTLALYGEGHFCVKMISGGAANVAIVGSLKYYYV
jgi:hypothetical protein